jgi:hypothetical protein
MPGFIHRIPSLGILKQVDALKTLLERGHETFLHKEWGIIYVMLGLFLQQVGMSEFWRTLPEGIETILALNHLCAVNLNRDPAKWGPH